MKLAEGTVKQNYSRMVVYNWWTTNSGTVILRMRNGVAYTVTSAITNSTFKKAATNGKDGVTALQDNSSCIYYKFYPDKLLILIEVSLHLKYALVKEIHISYYLLSLLQAHSRMI